LSPRAGGEAAKFGDRFEGRWTVRYLLDVLFGRAESVVVEDFDDTAESVEFYATVNGVEQGHQVKRQWRANVTWSISLLKSEGILRDAATHVRGRASSPELPTALSTEHQRKNCGDSLPDGTRLFTGISRVSWPVSHESRIQRFCIRL
jgi:hypothetical protein